jgi:transposase
MTNLQNSNNEASECKQAAKRYRRIKLGLDVHADWIVVVRILDDSRPQPAQKFSPASFLAWAKSQLEQAEEVHSCYEAGPFGYVLHRQLVTLGIHNVVVQPVCLDERHTGVNHDKSDAMELAQRLDRYVAGNARALALVRVPSPEEEQRRILSRQREQFQREFQRIAAQGRGLLLTQGSRQKKTWWTARQWESLRAELPNWLVERLESFQRILLNLKSELDALSTQLKKAAAPQRPKGLGGMTLEIIEREVGRWDRFANRRQVGSYTGLCGGVSSSGTKHRSLSITKHGNERLRTALVELAWRLVKWQPQSRLIQKWWTVLGNARATAAARKKAIVAIARQTAVDLWRWRTGRAKPDAFGWVMLTG